MGKKSIRRNYIYNVSYQILLILTPVITAPYLSRVLGADGVGIASATEADVSYFVLAATFGIAIFGQREISYVQDDRAKRSRVFWETKLLQILTSLIVLLVYIPFALHQENRILYLILTMNLLAVTASVTWFFQGMEEFGKIVLRNTVFKIVSILYIFAFVRRPSDLPLYVFGHSFFALSGDVSLWFYLPRYIDRPVIGELKPWKHLKEIVLLFVPSIAIQVYTVMDKTMIKVITRDAFENGYSEDRLSLRQGRDFSGQVLYVSRIPFRMVPGSSPKFRPAWDRVRLCAMVFRTGLRKSRTASEHPGVPGTCHRDQQCHRHAVSDPYRETELFHAHGIHRCGREFLHELCADSKVAQHWRSSRLRRGGDRDRPGTAVSRTKRALLREDPSKQLEIPYCRSRYAGDRKHRRESRCGTGVRDISSGGSGGCRVLCCPLPAS